MHLRQSPAVQLAVRPLRDGAYDLVVRITGTGKDQTTHDNVLFQTAQFITFTCNSRFGQDTSGFLERCSRDEGLGCQRRFGDTQQIACEGRTDFAVRFQIAVSDLNA